MSVITRYLTVLFLKHLILCLSGFLTLFLVVDFIEKITDFMTHRIPPWEIVLYFAAQLPFVTSLLIPVATLASVLITLVILARNSEIVAFKGSGVSLWRLTRPFLATGLVLCSLVFLLENLVTPSTAEIANRIWEGQVRNRRSESLQREVRDVWARDVRLLEHFAVYDESRGEAQGASLIFFDDRLSLASRIEAEGAFFTPEGARLVNAEVKTYSGQDGEGIPRFEFRREAELFLPGFPPPPHGLGHQGDTDSDEFSVRELSDSIDLLKAEGYYPIRQTVDLQFKFSRPFITLVMIIVGLPIGFWREKGGSVAMGLVPGLVLSFLYLVTLELSRSVGYAGLLPPFLAAWLPNGFFLLIGLYLFSYVRQ
ncbi:MAG: LptF/LptG family permease [Deltaproteobacteria bacterium]|nr:LptF/LptG family permease [Deltaproteobacteria bacterium]